MHFPIGRYRQMQRIGHPIDKHHPILAGHPVRPPCVEVLDRKRISARQGSDSFSDRRPGLNTDEVLACVIAWRPQQQWKAQPGLRKSCHAWHGYPRDASHPPSNAFPRSRSDQSRWIDHRSSATGGNPLGVGQRAFAQIGVTDRIYDQGVRRQRVIRVDEIGINRRDRENPVVDPMPRRHVATHRGNQHQQWNTGPWTPVATAHDRMAGEALPPMEARLPAQFGQCPRKALMGSRQIWVDRKRDLILRAGGRRIARLAQQIAVSHQGDRVGGIVSHRLSIGLSCGREKATSVGQRPQLSQRNGMPGIEPQHIEIGLLRRRIIALRHQPTGAKKRAVGHLRRFRDQNARDAHPGLLAAENSPMVTAKS
jgi:hypothetical protein